MSRETIQEAQEFLTINTNNHIRKIVDIEALLITHSTWRVKGFLDLMFREREKMLKDMLQADKTDHRIDETISKMFRLNMAIKTIEKEVTP